MRPAADLPRSRSGPICADGALLRRRHARRLARAVRGRLVLTYDDGPGTRLQPALLGLLGELGCRATFFLHGRRVEDDPAAARAVPAAGHEVAAHGYDHLDAWRVPGPVEARDVERGIRTVRRVLGVAVRHHRPPYGHATRSTLRTCARLGVACTWWTHDGLDARGDLDPESLPDAGTIARRIADAGGGVLLLHAHDRPDTSAGRAAERRTLEVTRAAVAAARARGLRPSTLEEVVAGPIPDRGRAAA